MKLTKTNVMLCNMIFVIHHLGGCKVSILHICSTTATTCQFISTCGICLCPFDSNFGDDVVLNDIRNR